MKGGISIRKTVALLIAFLLIMGLQPSFAEEDSKQLIIINKAINQLAFYDEGEQIRIFDVATGRKKSYTPEGTFPIVNKIKNRPYYKEKIPGGDPANPLGDRWLGLDALGTYGTTYAIHGNNNEDSIGKYVSAGCVRMHNEEIRWLFEQVELYTPVVIVDSDKSFDELAREHGYSLNVDLVKETNERITLFAETPLYQRPSSYHVTPYALSAQTVEAIAKIDGWYQIKTWVGSAWIKEEAGITGEIIPIEKEVILEEVTSIYSLPVKSSKPIGALSPQKVKAFEVCGDWLHIKSWLGYVWIEAPKNAL